MAHSIRAAKTGLAFSIFQKLLALILALVVITLSLPAVYLPARQTERFKAALENKARAYATLASKQVESAIAFNDRETAREVFNALALDTDIAALSLLRANGEVLHTQGDVRHGRNPKYAAAAKEELFLFPDRIVVVTPVVSLEGPRGSLVVELSRERLARARKEDRRQTAAVCLLALIVGATGAFWIARSLAQRLKAMARVAHEIAGGALDRASVGDTGRDEIGALAQAFNAMLVQLKASIAKAEEAARGEQARLEKLVAERTTELDARNADMRRVLDHVGQGFFMLDREGRISLERSEILARWLGKAPASLLWADYLSAVSVQTAQCFRVGWEAVVDGFMPLELTLSQLPARLEIAGRCLEIEYRPISSEAGDLERTLVVISDRSAEHARERAESAQRDLTRLFERVAADRDAVCDFIAEGHQLLAEIQTLTDSQSLRRSVHTLKGNASMNGLDGIAALCHELEDRLSVDASVGQREIAELVQRWQDLMSKIQPLLGKTSDEVQISVAEYFGTLLAIEQGVPLATLYERLQGWQLEPVALRLSRLGEHASALALRLGKGAVEVRVDAGPVRLDRKEWQEFWAASVHVLRNAVDHGIEDTAERQSLGKPVPAVLELRARLSEDHFMLEFRDDGHGIAWERVAEKARGLGLPSTSPADLTEALFADGLSTSRSVSEWSGRGAGLGAVRAACVRLGGSVEVESTLGVGTCLRLIWPASIAAAPAPRPRAARKDELRHATS